MTRDSSPIPPKITYGAFDWSEREQVLRPVARVSAPCLPARIVSFLQDELLTLVVGILVTNETGTSGEIGGGRG